jgi:hypothetical protein
VPEPQFIDELEFVDYDYCCSGFAGFSITGRLFTSLLMGQTVVQAFSSSGIGTVRVKCCYRALSQVKLNKGQFNSSSFPKFWYFYPLPTAEKQNRNDD